jgi:histidinol-phosphate aminotransferase
MTDSATMAHRYPDWYADSLRGDLASLHGVSTGQTIAGCGATEILRLSALATVDPDGNVVCPYPSYSQFPSDAGFLGASVNYSNLGPNHRVDLTDMASRVDGNTSAVCITNPNNPTATVLAATDIADFVDSLPSHVVTIIDEAYHEYVHDSSYQTAIDLVLQGKKVIVVRTFSKVYGLAGARIGYAIGPSSQIGAMSSWHLFATVSRLGLGAARAALTDSQHISDTIALNDQAKNFCFSNFDQMGLSYIPSETNFFMVDVGTSAGTVASQLATRGINVRTGWGMPQHLRVSTGTMEEMQSFIDALTEILGITGVDATPVPPVTALDGNYPNPFNRATQLSYSIAQRDRALLQVFDIRGRLIKTVVDEVKTPGRYNLDWNGRDQKDAPVSSGSYFFRLTVGDFSQTRRMILVR